MGHLEGAEDVVAAGPPAHAALLHRVRVRAEQHDVDEVVDAVDRVRHEHRPHRVQRPGRLRGDAGHAQAAIVAVPGAGVAEGDLALVGRHRVRVGDPVQVVPGRLHPEHLGRHRAHPVGVVHRDAAPELAKLGRHLDALGALRAGRVARTDRHVLAVLQLHRAPPGQPPVRQVAGHRLADAERRLAGVPGPLDRVAAARVAQRPGIE